MVYRLLSFPYAKYHSLTVVLILCYLVKRVFLSVMLSVGGQNLTRSRFNQLKMFRFFLLSVLLVLSLSDDVHANVPWQVL